MIFAKIGASSYALWALLHICLGLTRLLEQASLAELGEASGRLAQGHWTLLYVGFFVLVLSYYNWRNSTRAYWVSAFIVSAEDVGFLMFPVLYGGLPLPASVIGPSLWLVGIVFTSLAYVGRHDNSSMI